MPVAVQSESLQRDVDWKSFSYSVLELHSSLTQRECKSMSVREMEGGSRSRPAVLWLNPVCYRETVRATKQATGCKIKLSRLLLTACHSDGFFFFLCVFWRGVELKNVVHNWVLAGLVRAVLYICVFNRAAACINTRTMCFYESDTFSLGVRKKKPQSFPC